MQKIIGNVSAEGFDFDLAISGLDLSWEDAPLLQGIVEISWKDEDGAPRTGIFAYCEWVNEGEIERINRNKGFDHQQGNRLPEGTWYDIRIEAERLIEASDFDLTALDGTQKQAEEALAMRDEDLTLRGRDPYANHDWKIGRWIDEARMTFVDVKHCKNLNEVIAWANDDENFKEERDAA